MQRKVCLPVLCVILLSWATANYKRGKLVWSDEFDGNQVDQKKWTFLIGNGHGTQAGAGWGNNEKQWYTNSTENAFLQDGRLVIQAKKESDVNKPYTSARLVTNRTGDWKFGRIEIRAKFPRGEGIWPIICLLPSYEKYGPWPNSGQMVMAAMLNPNYLYAQVLFGRTGVLFYPARAPSPAASTFTEDFHNFVLDWREDQLIYTIDDEEVYNFTKTNDFVTATPSGNYPFNEKFHLHLILAVDTDQGKPTRRTTFPRRLELDYVRVYQNL